MASSTVLESFHYVPEPGWTAGAFTVLRAGKLAAAPGAGIERQRHAGQDVLFCVAGAGIVRTLGQRIELRPGQLAWIANEEPHAHAADASAPWTLLWFRLDGPDPAAVRKRLFGEGGPSRAAVSDAPALLAWFEKLFSSMRGRGIDLDWRLNQLVGEFLFLLGHALARPDAERMPEALGALLAAMRADLARPWVAAEAAVVTQLGPSQTRRLFRKHLRTSQRQWLLRERLIHAQSLIAQAGLPLALVAERCGFCDVYHFSRAFKRATGTSPAAWRRNELGA